MEKIKNFLGSKIFLFVMAVVLCAFAVATVVLEFIMGLTIEKEVIVGCFVAVLAALTIFAIVKNNKTAVKVLTFAAFVVLFVYYVANYAILVDGFTNPAGAYEYLILIFQGLVLAFMLGILINTFISFFKAKRIKAAQHYNSLAGILGVVFAIGLGIFVTLMLVEGGEDLLNLLANIFGYVALAASIIIFAGAIEAKDKPAKVEVKPAAVEVVAKKAPAKKPVEKKAPVKKAPVKKAPAKKTPAKKPVAKKAPAKKAKK